MLCSFSVNVHGSLRNRQKSIAPPIAAARTKVLFSISFYCWRDRFGSNSSSPDVIIKVSGMPCDDHELCM